MNYITDERITPYKIGLDENQFHLIKECTFEKGNNIGEKYAQTVGYYVSLESALNKIVKLSIGNTDYASIVDYLDAIQDKHDSIMRSWSGNFKIQSLPQEEI